jgi:hypothetical protein
MRACQVVAAVGDSEAPAEGCDAVDSSWSEMEGMEMIDRSCSPTTGNAVSHAMGTQAVSHHKRWMEAMDGEANPKRARILGQNGQRESQRKACWGSYVRGKGRREAPVQECSRSASWWPKSKGRKCGQYPSRDDDRRMDIHHESLIENCGGSSISMQGGQQTGFQSHAGPSFCKHGHQKSRCKECRQQNRINLLCKESGRASVCEHGRSISKCRLCAGPSVREPDRRLHGRHESRIEGRGGSSTSKQGQQKSRRKVYKTHSICEHGRREVECRECGGSSICEHGRRKAQCKDCGGSSICEHGRRRAECRDCGGSNICKHGRRKDQCRECGGSSFCEHGRRKSRCKECGGASTCKHGRERSKCKECSGS